MAAPFESLTAAVSGCIACSNMVHSHVIGAGNGVVPARVMFIGEAPGRLGAGRTGVPFQGDESGRRFQSFLELAGLSRAEIFVTNAVLCNPVDSASRNRRPLTSEVRRCLPFLQAQVEVIGPEFVVALGEVALTALGYVEGHTAALRTHCGVALPWCGRTLVPLYHPGRQSTLHRADELQRQDWLRLAEVVHRSATAAP